MTFALIYRDDGGLAGRGDDRGQLLEAAGALLLERPDLAHTLALVEFDTDGSPTGAARLVSDLLAAGDAEARGAITNAGAGTPGVIAPSGDALLAAFGTHASPEGTPTSGAATPVVTLKSMSGAVAAGTLVRAAQDRAKLLVERGEPDGARALEAWADELAAAEARER